MSGVTLVTPADVLRTSISAFASNKPSFGDITPPNDDQIEREHEPDVADVGVEDPALARLADDGCPVHEEADHG